MAGAVDFLGGGEHVASGLAQGVDGLIEPAGDCARGEEEQHREQRNQGNSAEG